MSPASERGPVRVCRVIARLNIGGPARHVVALSRGLRARGFETTLIAGRPGEAEGDMADLAREAGLALVDLPSLGRAPRPLRDLAALVALYRIFRRLRPRVVHTHTAKAGFLGRIAAVLAGVPVRVHTFHGHVLGEGYFRPLVARAIRAAERVLAQATHAIVAVSPRQRRDLVGRFRVAPAHKVRVIPLGIDLAPFRGARARHRGELRCELGIPGDAPLLGTVGRLVPVKAVDAIIRAFEAIVAARPDAHLAIVGDGPERPRLERLARDAAFSGRIRFTGFRRDLPRVYADLDVLLLASKSEGTPLALIEALAAGVPCIATAVGGVPDVLADGAGILVPPGDDAALARAALALFAAPTEGARLAAGGPAAVERFAEARLVADVADLYASLLRQ